MEKLISNPHNFKFYCIQPIHIEDMDLVNLFDIKIKHEKIQKFSSTKLPNWFSEFNQDLYNNTFVIDLKEKVQNTILQEELQHLFQVDDKYSLAEYLNLEDSSYYLLFDYRLFSFTLFFELSFDFSNTQIDQYIQAYQNKKDLYNTIRDILVKSEDKLDESAWAQQIKKEILLKTQNLIKTLYNYDISSNAISIKNNTGNISNIINLSNSQNNYSDLSKQLIHLNNIAERVKTFKTPIAIDYNELDTLTNGDIYNYQLFHFNGRFHTIIINDNDNKYRFIPIQLHMQFMWFYLKQINNILEMQYNNMIEDDSITNIDSQSKVIDDLITVIETLIMHNEKFKLAIEIDNERIYKKIQGNWNIESMLVNSNKYIGFFKEYLNRLYTKKTAKIERKQSNILAFISIFQFVGLLGVWGGYLSLMDDDIKNKADEIIHIFGDYNNLEFFNLVILPGIFFTITLYMIYYFFKKE